MAQAMPRDLHCERGNGFTGADPLLCYPHRARSAPSAMNTPASRPYLITFVGANPYTELKYRIGEHVTEPSCYFNVQLARFLGCGTVISVETKAATAKHGKDLEAALGSAGIEYQRAEIPDGKSETEIWEIFEALTARVPENAELFLDITNGFRSLPVLGFIALSYLRVTRRVTIGGVYYGAFDAKDPETGIAPAFELTPFLTLLDWTAAADQFFQTGDAGRLGQLLGETQQTLWQQRRAGEEGGDLPTKLKTLGNSISVASDNLRLLRSTLLRSGAETLARHLEDVRAIQNAADHARPFLELLAPVKDQLTRFDSQDLETLRDLAGWLAERNQNAAALTLANEWLINYAIHVCSGTAAEAGHRKRSPFAAALAVLDGSVGEDKVCEEEPRGGEVRGILETLRRKMAPDHLNVLGTTSSRVRTARNDLNHAGFGASPGPAASLRRAASEVVEALRALSL